MKITNENIGNLPISDNEKELLRALLVDLKDINRKSKMELYIDWIDKHTEYSSEWTDPCPDYYGMYQIKYDIEESFETIGVEMTLDELDIVLCALYNYIVDIP